MNNKKIFAEVDEVLSMMDDELVNKIPKSIRKLLKDSRDTQYGNSNKNILPGQQKLSKEAIAIITVFYLNYWCDDDKKRDELIGLIKENGK